MRSREAHPKNVEGPFYVENGCCTSCSVWEPYASGLIRYDDEAHCYFYRQPASPEELELAIDALAAADISCMRYGGSDPEVLKALKGQGAAHQCDCLEGEADET